MSAIPATATPVVVPEPEAVAVVPEPPAEQVPASGGWDAGHWATVLVAFIALGGVLWNTHRADKRHQASLVAAKEQRSDDEKAADKRRLADQEAADKRHQDTLEAAEQQRREENARAGVQRREDFERDEQRRQQERDDHESERLEQLQREDWARQRRAVADCVREITKASALVSERAAGVHLHDNGTTEHAKLVKAVELTHFYVEATNQLTLLDIEITQPHVSAQLGVLWEQLVSDYRPLLDARNRGGQEWIDHAESMAPLSDIALHGIRALTIMARLALLEHPELMETRPVVPIDLEEYHQNAQAGAPDASTA
ncbi:hypothetical protein NYP18_01955 [Corynebacterium sp. YIM 101645]|uniref:Secreted protein n=1 Tax=Corynebacterium lemuris TaxID=1859292 RepID=A0ABT2FV91_9CORY|nr:hypothetical protein [Corynebacterium lemuris]MCS5478413.1 hypothetical protein [Corynebacterium lemuris]